jgi:lipid II:glycine glycyltransferase (peptidoglycan interpeptide bridge formation enzyme)
LLFAKKRKFAYLAIQPAAQSDFVIPELEYHGFRKSTLELAPTATLRVDLRLRQDELLAHLKRQTKQNVRRSENAGIITRPGNAADIGTFVGLHQKTSQRQNFLPYPDTYFEHLWRLFSPGGNICILLAEYNQEAVSGLLLIAYGDTVAAKLIGWSGAYPDLRPNDALFWGAINWSKSNGYSWFDFEGINRQGALAWLQNGELPEQYRHTPDFLKYGYGGEVAILPEAYENSFNPLISLAMKNLKLHVNDQSWSSKFVDRIRKR